MPLPTRPVILHAEWRKPAANEDILMARRCELTGKAIPKARLEAIPWTRFTVEAQAQLEREGALRSRRIGQLGTIDSVGVSEVETEEDEPEEKTAKEKE